MVWEHVINKNPDVRKLKPIEGLDVISPTWFAVVDGEGNVANNADMEYVEWAHKNGYQVWGLASNDFNPDITHEFLNNTDIREKIISQLLIYAKLYKLDGINIDFENIYVKDRDMLTQFMRELYPLCREQGLTLSMDVHSYQEVQTGLNAMIERLWQKRLIIWLSWLTTNTGLQVQKLAQ